jgi:Ala-tRNA(Pro) deacylase
MIPQKITDYLQQHGAAFEWLPHARAITAQDLAQSLHVSGHAVGKVVVVEADGQRYMAVLSASEIIDPRKLGDALGARSVQLCTEGETLALFPGCELGAEPPFGRLFGLPVLVDRSLARQRTVVFRAGSHSEAIRMDYATFASIEEPTVTAFGVSPDAERLVELEARP